MSSQLRMARELAKALLAGQTDKAGRPAFSHAERVAGKLGVNGATLAYLHDLVEDTDLTLSAVDAVFGPDIAGEVDALTRREGEVYADYIGRVCRASDLARRVKLADIEDHLDHVADIPESLADRYRKAQDRIEESLERGVLPSAGYGP